MSASKSGDRRDVEEARSLEDGSLFVSGFLNAYDIAAPLLELILECCSLGY